MIDEILDATVVAQLLAVIGAAAFADVVALYAEESSALLDGLARALAAGDTAAVAAQSHSLSTSSATVGAGALAAACKSVERQARAGRAGADAGAGAAGAGAAEDLAGSLRSLHASSVAALRALGAGPS